jgi:hypothetical protein
MALKGEADGGSIPWRASSFGGGTQQARSAANISRIESSPCSFAVMASPFSFCDAFSSVETIVNLKSCPIRAGNEEGTAYDGKRYRPSVTRKNRDGDNDLIDVRFGALSLSARTTSASLGNSISISTTSFRKPTGNR